MTDARKQSAAYSSVELTQNSKGTLTVLGALNSPNKLMVPCIKQLLRNLSMCN